MHFFQGERFQQFKVSWIDQITWLWSFLHRGGFCVELRCSPHVLWPYQAKENRFCQSFSSEAKCDTWQQVGPGITSSKIKQLVIARYHHAEIRPAGESSILYLPRHCSSDGINELIIHSLLCYAGHSLHTWTDQLVQLLTPRLLLHLVS